MILPDEISILALLASCGYFFFSWMLAGHNPKKGTVVPFYNPPSGLSPGLTRYIWKEKFDDRTFWASVLSLVARGLAVLQDTGGRPVLHSDANPKHLPLLPAEECVLLQRVLADGKHKGMAVNMLDPVAAWTAGQMADSLRQAALGRWFRENRSFVICGIAVSVAAVGVVARPHYSDQWMSFVCGVGVMAPGAFYLFFILLRIADVLRSMEEKIKGVLFRCLAMLIMLAVPCVAAIILGSIVLAVNFGWFTLIAAGFLTGLNLLFTQIIKTRTSEGQILEDHIEGFRLFLGSVEHLPLDREEGPGPQAGLYEKYLPFAVALEVEQKWGDRFVALASTIHQNEALAAAHSFYLGMCSGKPVEMVFSPEPPRR